MATNAEIAQMLQEMTSRYEPTPGNNLSATIQFDLSGDNGGMYWVKLSETGGELGEGTAESANMTLRATADDLFSILTRTLDPMQAFVLGKLRVSGDTNIAMRLMSLINS